MKRKQSSRLKFEQSLIADASNPEAWEHSLHVEPLMSTPIAAGIGSKITQAKAANERSPQELNIIGEVAVWFANLELYLELSIWQLISAGDEEQRHLVEAVTAEMSFDRKVHAFSSLFKLRFPEEAEDSELNLIVRELFSAQQGRNAILHSGWFYSADEQAFTRMKASAKAKHGLTRRIYPMPLERLATVRDQIGGIGQHFARFSMTRIQERLVDRREASPV
jgi:hypothetical protein